MWGGPGDTSHSCHAFGGVLVTARQRTETQPWKLMFQVPWTAPPHHPPSPPTAAGLSCARVAVSEAEPGSPSWGCTGKGLAGTERLPPHASLTLVRMLVIIAPAASCLFDPCQDARYHCSRFLRGEGEARPEPSSRSWYKPGAGFRPRPRPFLGLPERRRKALGGTRVWSWQVLLRP